MSFLQNPYIQFILLVIFTMFYIWFFIFRKRKNLNDKLLEKLKNDPIIIDLRPQQDVKNEAGYPNSINIQINQLYNKSIKWDKNKNIILYCQNGFKSSEGAKILKDAGFKNITNAGSLKKLKKSTGIED